jgi:hypothetical protein
VTPGSYPERYILDPGKFAAQHPESPQAPFWRDFAGWIGGAAFPQLLLAKFQAHMDARFGAGASCRITQDINLLRDFTNYSIGPHTDSPHKMVSLLFYFPRDDGMQHLGTSIFEPVDPAFTSDGTGHFPFADFRKVYTAPYRPNSLFGFFKTHDSWHGVEPIGDQRVERNLMAYNIYLSKVVQAAPPPAAGRWPWSKHRA